MAAERHDLEKRLSGGAAETDPNLALGGAMSTAVILSQEVIFFTPMSGVTEIEGRGNTAFGISPSLGAVAFINTTTELRWQPPSEPIGALVDVSVDGRYTLPGPNDLDLLIVDVVAASLPISDTNSVVSVETLPNTLFDDVGAIEAFLGTINYRCYYVRNRSAGDTLFGVKVFISAQPSPGGDTLALGLDPAGINGVATTIGDEDTAPGGVSFTIPTSYAGGLLIGDLAPGDFAAIWQRRTVPPSSTFPAPRDNSEIAHGMFF